MNSRKFKFSTDLHVLEVRELRKHDFRKWFSIRLSLCEFVCDKYLVCSVPDELTHGTSQNLKLC